MTTFTIKRIYFYFKMGHFWLHRLSSNCSCKTYTKPGYPNDSWGFCLGVNVWRRTAGSLFHVYPPDTKRREPSGSFSWYFHEEHHNTRPSAVVFARLSAGKKGVMMLSEFWSKCESPKVLLKWAELQSQLPVQRLQVNILRTTHWLKPKF